MTFEKIAEEFWESDVCMGETLLSIPADGLSLEEAFELNIAAKKWADGDRFYRITDDVELEELGEGNTENSEKMNKFDFIRFGVLVQWVHDSTGAYREMQVCIPPKEPISDNTKIGLIPTDEDKYEETPSSYTVKAAELFPCLEPFQEGYWKAIQEAEKSGADEEVLLAMLKSMSVGMTECIYLMLQSDYYKLYPILSHLFPEMEDVFQVITWENRDYPARRLTIFKGTNDEREILVSVTRLEDKLIDSEAGAPVSDEAEEVDGDIYYYLTDEEMRLPDKSIAMIVEGV